MVSGLAWRREVVGRLLTPVAPRVASVFPPEPVSLMMAAEPRQLWPGNPERRSSSSLYGFPGNQMNFPRKYRLTSKADYRHVFSRPESSRDHCFRVLSRTNSQGHCRLGLAVSKKNNPRAVDRSRIKRVIRESFRMNLDSMNTDQGIDLVVLPTAAATSICNRDLFISLEKHWKENFSRHARKKH